ncbi:hypothetical protein ACUIJQ_06465 [Levilactobacillus hammesii]|nr:hypothetical protein [Levilactobacillus hammesii]
MTSIYDSQVFQLAKNTVQADRSTELPNLLTSQLADAGSGG